jgi:hypothetical protein
MFSHSSSSETRYLFSLLQTIDDFITDHHQRLLLVIFESFSDEGASA